MKEKLFLYRQQGLTVKMIYMKNGGVCSERRVLIRKLGETSFTAYCLKRRAVRTFHYDRILSMKPMFKKEKLII
ncbi:WYL domain-containing protein [Jeotgalibacillus terrae]|uniref:Transcriptional regulator n=1 Tax=Jeotgalibacillus terrae TaxID=587735 RepID=A0ABW5ZLX2_9BACL|nr:transcriptional regulator [Jeotgalibacillus terrae]MBM7578014.1 putative DNA-binding transcriptional regulator YafY [Jeotgalibacillus terrae]